jgi:ATP-dependent DNA ligase
VQELAHSWLNIGATAISSRLRALTLMLRISTRGIKVPSSPDWLHEIKYDGYRLRVERDGDRVRLITRV